MQEFIPKYILRSSLSCEIIRFEQTDSGYWVSFYVRKAGNDSFILKKSKHSVSAEFRQYREKILRLKEKYKHLLLKGCCFTTCFKDDKVYLGYNNPESGSVILEELTDVRSLSSMKSTPEIVTLTTTKTNDIIRLFDSSKNGYNALINAVNYSDEHIKFQKKSKCSKCGCDTFKVIVNIHNTGKKDLLEEQRCDEINESNWTDAFDWISIDLECPTCGKKIKSWFELETM